MSEHKINYQNIYQKIIFNIFQERNILTPEDFVKTISRYIDENNSDNLIKDKDKENFVLYKIAEQFNIININNTWKWKWIL